MNDLSIPPLRHDGQTVRHVSHPGPTVEAVTVTRVVHARGVGCCEESPYRWVTSYFLPDGSLIAEMDPAVPGVQR